MSDLSQAIVARDIKVSNAIGAYANGDVIDLGTSITDIIAKLLQSQSSILYASPSGSLAYAGQKDTIYVDYHSTATIDLSVELVQGDAGNFILPANLVMKNEGKTYNNAITSADMTMSLQLEQAIANIVECSAVVQYSEGQVKPGDASGIDKIYAGLLSLDVRIIPVYNAYVGSIELFETFDNLIAEDIITNCRLIHSNQLAMTYTGLHDYQIFACPSDCNLPIINNIADVKDLTINNIAYKVYCIQARTLSINTASIQ
jgi:hypothetical protein